MRRDTLTSRVIVALFGIPLLLVLTYLGGWWTALLVAIIGIGSQLEYYRLLRDGGYKPLTVLGVLFGALLLLVSIGAIDINAIWIIIVGAVFFLCAGLLFNRSHIDAMVTTGGLIYPLLLSASFIYIRQWSPPPDMEAIDGRWLAFAVWGAIWS